jgi:CBS domain-containing protein
MATTETDPVRSIVAPKVLGVTPKTPLEAAALRLMTELRVQRRREGIRRLLVVDGHGRLVGIVARRDLLTG